MLNSNYEIKLFWTNYTTFLLYIFLFKNAQEIDLELFKNKCWNFWKNIYFNL